MYLEKAEEELSLFLKWGDPGNEAITLAKVLLAKVSHSQNII